MTVYAVIDKTTLEEIFRYQADAPVELTGMEFATHDHVALPTLHEDGSIEGVFSKRRLTKLEFIEKLGDTAFVAILQMAKVSPLVEAWVEKMKLTTPDPDGTSVDLDDPRTVAGIQAMGMALEAQGIVAAGWADGVLA